MRTAVSPILFGFNEMLVFSGVWVQIFARDYPGVLQDEQSVDNVHLPTELRDYQIFCEICRFLKCCNFVKNNRTGVYLVSL